MRPPHAASVPSTSACRASARRTQGFTLIELLITMLLFALLLLMIYATADSSLKLFRTDQAQIKVNRNGRGLLDTLGIDVREAGENLTADFPAIRVTSASDGSSVLTLRRGLLDDPLAVCSVISTGSTTVYVNSSTSTSAPNYSGVYANGGSTGGGSALQTACTVSAVDLSTWQTAIAAGTTTGYLYNVTADTGAFVTLSAASSNVVTFKFNSAGVAFQPRAASSSVTAPLIRLYLLEDHTYALSSGMMTLSVNGAAAVAAAPGVTAFTVTPYISSTATAGLPFLSITGSSSPSTYGWRDLDHLGVTLSVSGSQNGRTEARTYSENYLPRNVLSNDN